MKPTPTIVIARSTATRQSPPTITATPILVTPTPTSTPTKTPIVYIVGPGDTLVQIATIYNMDVYDLARANNIAIEDMNLIQVGQIIVITDPKPVIPPTPTLLVGKQIVVVLSTQRVYAFENGVLLQTFIVSTGVPEHPTPTTDKGDFHIYVKYRYTYMTDGATYFLKDVPYTMYFYQGYGFHGTYWHHNFGRPMSHGCINLQSDPVDDARWLYEWAEIGTDVHIIN